MPIENVNQSNSKENSNQITHIYKVDDLVLVKNKQSSKYSKDTYNGPWEIQEVRDNGTVKIAKCLVSDI